eukprot:scaffold8545_cov76-Skeletonema_dohrnii-CCMP3373.AAC.4
MSGTNNLVSAAAEMLCCACCGITEGDDIKLKTCTACKTARYCSVKCQKEHRPKHKGACKKRAAELRDELLFKQPESSHYGDCPICCLPMPIGGKYSTLMACCSKIICNGCVHANQMRELQGNLQQKCPFCRNPAPKTAKESEMRMMKRIEVNDSFATFQIGIRRHDEGNYEEAFKYYTKAAGLGNVESHYNLSLLYRDGKVEKDEKNEVYHLERAAIGGHPGARHNLGCKEAENGNYERAVKHMIIASSLGYVTSMEMLKMNRGHVNKEDFAAALRANQAALDTMKSPQREAAGRLTEQQRT